jgi:ABC-type transport system involved in multi-copper enzyme maturation permease subunit
MFGKALFGLMIWMELIAVCFTAPALTSGAIASERERQTFDLLRVTLLSPGRMILGKYLSGLVFIFLLLFSSLPMQSLAFIIGGVQVEEILIAVLILAVTAVSFCAVGLFFSSLFSRVLFATVLSYAFAIFMVFGIPMIALFLLVVFNASLGYSMERLSVAGQIFLIFIGWLVVSLTPGATIVATEAALLDHQGIFLAKLNLGNGTEVVMPSPWLAYVIFYLIVSGLLLWISYLRVQNSG